MLAWGCAAVVALSASGCGSSTPGVAGLVEVDGGRQITVPVLWADPSKSIGGIEPALVWVGKDSATEFSIDLGDLRAEGAGAAWTAASASAAAVGTLYSGRDPRDINVWFTVTGPIDGPSAGAFLTVAILAALRDVPLLPGVTMSGTVSPDGTVSAVGGVGLKLQAAAEAGYSTVLLPASNTLLTASGTGESITAVDAGRQLGLTVVHVATIAQAYELLTGETFVAEYGDPYVLPPPVIAAAKQTARDLLRETTVLRGEVSRDAPELTIIDDDLAAAGENLDTGDPASAYARATEALFSAGRAVTVEKYQILVRDEGLDAAKRQLIIDIDSAIAEADAALAQGSNIDGLGLESAMSTPTALSWSAYARAALRALAPAVPNVVSEEQLLTAVTVLNEQSVSVRYLQPDALEVVRAMPSRELISEDRVADYLSGYTQFLIRGARANAQYIADVVLPSIPAASTDIDDVRALAPILRELAHETGAIDRTTEDVDTEVAQAALAITDFVTTTAFIAATQGAAAEGFNMVTEAPTLVNSDAVQSTFDTSRQIVADAAALVSNQGSDAGYPVWSAAWGSAAFQDLAREGRAGAGAVLAFNELWFDTINLQMIYASDEALSIGAGS